MDHDGLRVDHAGLEAAAQELQTAVKEIDARLDRLETELAPLTADWSGDAQASYRSAKARWDGAIRDMRHLLDQTSRAVRQSNAEYQAADQRGAAAFEI